MKIDGSNKIILFFFTYAEDEVYMPNEAWLDEYVLNDHGILYRGSANSISASRWYFGQVQNYFLLMLKIIKSDSSNFFTFILCSQSHIASYKKESFGLRNITLYVSIGSIVLASCQFIDKNDNFEFHLNYL